MRCRITEIQALGRDDYVWWSPSAEPQLVEATYAQLEHQLHLWFLDDGLDGIDFQNMMFSVLCPVDAPAGHDMKLARIYVHWIEHRFYDCWPSDIDPDRAQLLETAYMAMLEDMPTWQLRHQMSSLAQQWHHLPSDYPDFPRPDPPAQHRPYNRSHLISSAYADLSDYELGIHSWRLLNRVPATVSSPSGCYYVVHLYSGHRREDDFHSWMQRGLHDRNIHHVVVLSIDTAIHETMNIHSKALWDFLVEIARCSRLIALLLGPPCETWSSARFEILPGDLRGPRPLRLSSSTWGLHGLSFRELQQVRVGNVLLLKGLWLAVIVALHRGSVVLEHPSLPFDDQKPSIWKTALLLLLTRRPNALFFTKSLHQWRYGSPGVKPTTFLCANISIDRPLSECIIPGISKPVTSLIGRHSDGSFKTSAAKEYPSALNRAISLSFLDKVCCLPGSDSSMRTSVDEFGDRLACLSSCLDSGRRMPDYQPEMAPA